MLELLQGDEDKSWSSPMPSHHTNISCQSKETATEWLSNDNDCCSVHCWALIRFFLASNQIKKKKPGHSERQDWPISISTGLSQDAPGSLSLFRKSRPFTVVTWNEVNKDIAHQAMSCSHDPLCQKFLSPKNTAQQALENIHLWRPRSVKVFTSYTNCPVLNRQELWNCKQIGKTLRKTFETHCPFQHLCLIDSPSVPKSSMEKMKTPSSCFL